MNHKFLKEKGISHIVNTAKGLDIFGPKYLVRSIYISVNSGLSQDWLSTWHVVITLLVIHKQL